jgi:hypothetical protein
VHIDRHIILPGRRNNQAWFAPSAAVVPAAGTPRVFVRVLQLTGNDLGPEHFLWTDNLGETWTPPWESLGILKIPLDDDVFEWPAFGLYYHRKTNSLLGLGTTLFSRDRGDEFAVKSEVLVFDRKNHCAWTVWNHRAGDFQPWKVLEGVEDVLTPGCGQWHECDDGTIFMPFIHCRGNEHQKVGTLKLHFDGAGLTVLGSGRTVGLDREGGADEPSITRFGGRFLMTIRSEYKDRLMYLAQSTDGLNWDGFQPWTWDDGAVVETRNTQQHWLTRKNELYLVYTRASELNNGVFRCRAPLFMARVDPDRLCLVGDSEVIVFPENGARMGNFCVVNVAENESWIFTGEWREQFVPGHRKGMRFWVDVVDSGNPCNRNQYIGNLLLAKIHFDG